MRKVSEKPDLVMKTSSMLGWLGPFSDRHGACTHFFWHIMALRQGFICGKALAN